MCKQLVSGYVCFVVLFAALGFLSGSNIKAADMTITNLSPANNAVEVCADTKLWITFSTAPIAATSGKLQICKVLDNNVVWDLNLYSLPNPPVAAGWPAEYKINLNGRIVNYEPFAVSGNTIEIYPSTRLDYNTVYYVKITAGFCTDASGNTSPAITDNTTWRFTTKAAAPAADHDWTVALDGSGDFCTLQGACDAVTNSDPCRTLVKVKKGTYREIVNIPSGKANMTWLGEDRDTTIMAVYNCENFNPGSDYRMMIRGSANGFRMYNMTYHNLKPKGGSNAQAETIKHSGQQSIVKNCKYMSYQDTLCLNGQMYLQNCYIEGDVDYVWGYGTVYFDGCEMHTLTTKGYNTQPRQASLDVNGFIFVDCNLTSPSLTNCYLGRGGGSGYPYGQTVYINCTMPPAQFYPVGWLLNGTDPCNLRFWEYMSVDTRGILIDVNNRLTPGSRQLTDDEAAHLRDVNNIFGVWNPKAIDLPTAAWQLNPANGATGVSPAGVTLSWASGEEATSHLVYFGTTNSPDPIGEQTGNSYATEALTPGTTYYWQIDEKNTAGTTAGTLQSFTTALYSCTSALLSDFDGNCQVNFFDYVILADAWIGDTQDFNDLAQLAAEWLLCNRSPANQCWQ
ncbi:MAG: pectinesterase family protein [Sedimentisphaerales bacterium]